MRFRFSASAGRLDTVAARPDHCGEAPLSLAKITPDVKAACIPTNRYWSHEST
jgi:hypothetical protein